MKNVDIEAQQPSEQELIETAAEMSAHYFKGIELKPFSFSRQAACERLATSMGAAGLEADTLLVFICTKDRAEIERTRTPAGREAFLLEMEQWADDQQIGLMTQEGKDLQKVANAIWSELEASKAEPVEPKARPGEKPEPLPPN